MQADFKLYAYNELKDVLEENSSLSVFVSVISNKKSTILFLVTSQSV
jgi:hypothetical protein